MGREETKRITTRPGLEVRYRPDQTVLSGVKSKLCPTNTLGEFPYQ